MATTAERSVAVSPSEEQLEEHRQMQDIEQGIAEADRGEFAKIEDVDVFLAKYGA